MLQGSNSGKEHPLAYGYFPKPQAEVMPHAYSHKEWLMELKAFV
jgi:hypothetical protein